MSVNEPRRDSTAPTGCLGLILRVFWLGIGNAFLLLLAVSIAQRQAPLVADVIFWALVGLLVWARYFDVTRLNGLTAEGKPASLHHWRRYATFLVASAALLWALAHGTAHVLL